MYHIFTGTVAYNLLKIVSNNFFSHSGCRSACIKRKKCNEKIVPHKGRCWTPQPGRWRIAESYFLANEYISALPAAAG